MTTTTKQHVGIRLHDDLPTSPTPATRSFDVDFRGSYDEECKLLLRLVLVHIVLRGFIHLRAASLGDG